MKLQYGLDRTRARAFVYHATDPEQDKQVYIEEKQQYLDDGWLKSPALRGQEVEKEAEPVDEGENFIPKKKKGGRPRRIKK